MSRGILLFAINTKDRSYANMATYCSLQIKKYLNLPVTIVTNGKVNSEYFDKVIDTTVTENQIRLISGKTEDWKNFNRYRAYELSPYDETILMDIDYICNSDKLLQLFDLNQDFLCHKTRRYLGSKFETTVEHYGKNYEMYWATIIYFKKNSTTKSVFEMIKTIQDNYLHYSRIYKFSSTPYRNDFALSIALNTVYGHNIPSYVEIPWTLMNVEFDTEVDLVDDIWTIKFNMKHKGKLRITTKNQDLHMLNKNDLEKIINDSGLCNISTE